MKKYFGKFKAKPPQIFTDIFDSLSDGVIVLDVDRALSYWNPKIEKLFSLPLKNVQGRSFETIQPLKNLPTFAACLHLLQGGKNSEGKIQIYPHPETEETVIIVHDSSEDERIQEMGRDFIANASHELRTPITIIKGFAETLQEVPQITESMLEGILEKIMRNCTRMDNLVRNLLLLADIDALPRARMQKVDLVGLVENCTQTLCSLHPEVVVQNLHNKSIVSAKIDPDLFELAISNLLENAVKYSASPAEITITLDEKKKSTMLQIQDNGMGIPEEELKKIFDRFYTVNKSHSRSFGGAGLGLSIVHTIVSKHRGVISVTSELGRGTTFTIELPLT